MKNIVFYSGCRTFGKLIVSVLTHIRLFQAELSVLPTQWQRGSGARGYTSVWVPVGVAQRAQAELRVMRCAHSPMGAVAALLEQAPMDEGLVHRLVSIGRAPVPRQGKQAVHVEVTASVQAEVVAYAVANDITIKQAATYLLSSHPVLMAIRQAADREPVVVLDDATSEAQALS